MIVPMTYTGESGIVNGLHSARVAFATNTLRETTYFRGDLGNPLLFREALAAMYHVVVSDYKYRPKDRFEFQAWLQEQDRKFLANLGLKGKSTAQQMEKLEVRLAALDENRRERLRPFHRARRAYFDHIYENEYELAMLLDPVITVHPDEVSFEAFSRDESTYARIGAKYELFKKVNEFECGTTNIDFSTKLHHELERMRSYRQTHFDIDPSGFAVMSNGGNVHKEKKIDLPDSWVNGFLQVHSTMSLGLTHFQMPAVDLFNICRYLRRRRARHSPRALRFELQPGQAVKVVLEPWEHVIELTPETVYHGEKPQSIRTWGRDRLQVMARLLPVCRKIDVYLAGFGLPTIYVLDLGPITFTVALSGWTDNDWTGAAKFDLLARRLDATEGELTGVYESLQKARYGTYADLAKSANVGKEKCRSALSFLCQVGRAMYDLGSGVFRHRELFMTPFSAKEALKTVKKPETTNPEQKAAEEIVARDNIRIIMRRPVSTGYKLSGSAKGADNRRVRPLLHVDHEGRIITAECTCAYHKKSKLTKGPCQHILALRLAHMDRLEKES